ncbi:MAG: hypothetical protein V6Z81_03650 [Parvularculales bacterium]
MMHGPEIRNSYPRLNDRAAGWLRFLHRKATTPDDWSEDGEPHPWWDGASTPPMLSFPRFDLSESCYAIGVMADRTPAWREVYGEILNGLAERHVTYWAAIDWLTQFGPDPRRKSYPQEWIDALIPEHLVGEYDVPGWVANDIEPWGMQPDPIGADGNLFFKGWLNLIQSLHAYVTGEDKWGDPFMVAGVDRARFEWTQHRIVEHLVSQWTASPLGPHCENTKIWPYCLSAAGLGLQLYDAVFGKSSHHVYGRWLEHNKDRYFGISGEGKLEWAPMYYDPLVDHMQTTAPPMGLAISFYMMPQAPAFAEFLYRAAVSFLGWDNPQSPVLEMPDPRFMALGLAVSREYGDYVTEARLRDYAERHFEPRFFGRDNGDFGFWFNLGEDWPRGQMSSLAMVAEVGEPGAWRNLFLHPDLDKHHAPTVEGVDYPSLGVAQAWNDTRAGQLQLTVFAGNAEARGNRTSFRVTTLPDAGNVRILCDGGGFSSWRAVDERTIEIETDINAHSFQIYTGYRSDGNTRNNGAERVDTHGAAENGASEARFMGEASRGSPQAAGGTSGHILLRSGGCPCCPSAAGSVTAAA